MSMTNLFEALATEVHYSDVKTTLIGQQPSEIQDAISVNDAAVIRNQFNSGYVATSNTVVEM